MDRRKSRLIIIGVVGVLVLIIGIGAARIYTQTYPMEARDSIADLYYNRNYSELTADEKAIVDGRLRDLGAGPISIAEKNEQFREWLVKWVVIPVCAFIILTGAMVASRLILDRIRRR